MSRSVLVTGANSMIGSWLIERLVREGEQVWALVRPQSDLTFLESVRHKIKFIYCDIRDEAAVAAACQTALPSLVYHLASTVWSKVPMENQSEHHEVIVSGTANLLSAARSIDLRRVVMAGSAASYGSGGLLRESTPVKPDNVYGQAKAAASNLLSEFSATTGIAAIELRLFTPYGPRENTDRFIPSAIRQMEANQPLELTSGVQQRDFVFVSDVVEAFVCAADADVTGFEIVNIGSGSPMTISAAANTIKQILGSTVEIRIGAIPNRTDEILEMQADISKASSLLNWQPKVSFQNGILLSRDWYSSQLESV